jgi:hypothetical protein
MVNQLDNKEEIKQQDMDKALDRKKKLRWRPRDKLKINMILAWIISSRKVQRIWVLEFLNCQVYQADSR